MTSPVATPVAHPAPRRPHVVIVGGGFAGLHAARALRDTPVQITLVDRTNHHLFQPLLYQVATASLSPGDITAPIRWVLRKQRNVFVMLGEVVGIDPASRTISLDSARRSITYDYLVLAPGGRHSYFAHPEWESLAPGLKSVEDAAEMRRRFLLSFERAELCDDEAERAGAIPDIAHVVCGGRTVPGVAPAAMQQGRWAGRNIARTLAEKPRVPFGYFNKGDLATIGRHKAVADFGRFRFGGRFAWWLWLTVHIMYLIGFRNRLTVLIEWAYAYFTYERGVRLITGSERVPSRT